MCDNNSPAASQEPSFSPINEEENPVSSNIEPEEQKISPVIETNVSSSTNEIQKIISPTDNEQIPEIEPSQSIPIICESEPLPFTSTVAAVTTTNSPKLVPVKGNTKVYRCLKCKTFVSASKPHTDADCLARCNKETKTTNRHRRKNDKKLLKSLKMLEKKNSSVLAKSAVLTKKAQALVKKFGKKSKKSSPTIPKQIINFLDLVSKKFQ